MLHSEEFLTLIKRFCLLSVGLFLFCFLFSWSSVHLYETYLFQQNAKIFSQLVEVHPELEEEIAGILQEPHADIEKGQQLLEQYGLTKDNLLTLDSSSFLRTMFLTTFGFFFGVLVFITIFYLLHLRKIYQKLDRINEYINEVLNDRFPLSLKEYKEGAFSTLKNDVYKITNKLKDQKEQLAKDKLYLESTLSDISHQLKTPLTSMYVINNLLEDAKLDPKIRSEFIHKNELQLERIEWLVTSLLKLSRLESGTIQLKAVKLKISELVDQALESLKIPIELKNQTLVVQGKKNVMICCDRNWTREALVNIIKNAHEHTEKEGTITISWEENPIYVELRIQDTGEGIAKEDLHHIFERFYKGSHNSKESIGIGLNMSRQVLTRQNATIEVESELGVGTTFLIRFFKNTV